MKIYKLKKPIMFDGETIDKIEMDLENLTVRQLDRAEREARELLPKGERHRSAETTRKYFACVAAKAAGVKVDMVLALYGVDYTQLCLEVQNFLYDGALDEEDEDEETEEYSETRNMMSSQNEMSTFRDYMN